MRAVFLLAALALAPLGIAPAAGQGMDFAIPRERAPFLILEQDRLFTGSKYGQAVIAMNEAEAQALREEGQRLDRQFEEEERQLTERRADLDPAAFRELADAFDNKVVATRRAQDEKAQALAARTDRRRRQFFRRAGPVLLQLLEESGAAAVVEQRSVLVAKQDLNITDQAIERLDAAFNADPNAASNDVTDEE